jgi:hypothetical protein
VSQHRRTRVKASQHRRTRVSRCWRVRVKPRRRTRAHPPRRVQVSQHRRTRVSTRWRVRVKPRRHIPPSPPRPVQSHQCIRLSQRRHVRPSIRRRRLVLLRRPIRWRRRIPLPPRCVHRRHRIRLLPLLIQWRRHTPLPPRPIRSRASRKRRGSRTCYPARDGVARHSARRLGTAEAMMYDLVGPRATVQTVLPFGQGVGCQTRSHDVWGAFG